MRGVGIGLERILHRIPIVFISTHVSINLLSIVRCV